jgi:hypothetical protein
MWRVVISMKFLIIIYNIVRYGNNLNANYSEYALKYCLVANYFCKRMMLQKKKQKQIHTERIWS